MPAIDWCQNIDWRQYGKMARFTPQPIPRSQRAVLLIDGEALDCLVSEVTEAGNGFRRIEVLAYPTPPVVLKPPKSRIDRLLADEELV